MYLTRLKVLCSHPCWYWESQRVVKHPPVVVQRQVDQHQQNHS